MIHKPRNAPFTARQAFPIDSPDVGVQIIDFPDVIRVRVPATQIAPGIYEADLTAPDAPGDYAVLWDSDGDLWRWEDLHVTPSLYIPATETPPEETPAGPYATPADIAARLGRTLTAQEVTSYESIIEAVSAEVDVRLGKSLADAPPAIKGVVVTASIRGAANPTGAARVAETIGALSRSETFPKSGDGSTFLTATEERLIRRAIFGRTTGSPRIGSVLDDVNP